VIGAALTGKTRRWLGACLCALALAVLPVPAPAQEASPEPRHAISMYGEPDLPPGFAHLPYANPAAPKGGRLTLGYQGSFDSLNPYAVRGNAPPALSPYVVQPLMFRSQDESFTLYPLLAESVTTPRDRSWVSFRLNPKAAFSDGKPVTAEDVLFSWDLLKRKGRPYHRGYYGKVVKAQALDSHSVRFDFGPGADYELPLILALMPVIARHATDPEKFEMMGFTPLVGSGPYLFGDIEPGARFTLKRRADFWAADLPTLRGFYNFDEIRFEYFRDSNTFLEAFRTGVYDYRVELDPTRWTTGYASPALADGRYVKEGYLFKSPRPVSGFMLNARRAPLNDRRVREALGFLFDFEWLNKNLFRGLYRRTAGFFAESQLSSVGVAVDTREQALLAPFPGDIPAEVMQGTWRPPETDGSGRDRKVMGKAVALLRDAGFELRDGEMVDRASGRPLAFDIMVDSRDKERIALAFADTLKLVGIRPRIRLVDTSQYWARLRSFDFDVIIETYGATASPGNEQENRWTSAAAKREASLNYPGVSSPVVDAMIRAMLAARDRDDYVSAVRALDRALISGAYVIPLYYAPERWVARWTRAARPDRLPAYDFTPDVWWRAAP
jgi:peptide/nickel transport system substrate-binding protein